MISPLLAGTRRLVAWRRCVPYCAAGLAIAGGTLTILGWLYDWSWAKDPLHTNFMSPNTALCLIVAGIALICRHATSHRIWNAIGAALGALVALAGLAISFEYLSGMDLGIDRLFLANTLYQWGTALPYPGRFPPNTAASLALIGLALVLANRNWRAARLAEVFSLPVLFLSFLTIIGYAYKAEPLYVISSYSSQSLHVAILLGILAFGTFWMRGESGFSEFLLEQSAGGVAARRLLLATLLTLPVLGWIHVRAEVHGWLGPHFGIALLVIVSVIFFAIVIMQTAFKLESIDEKRKAAEQALLRSHAELESLVLRRTATLRNLSARLIRAQDDERRKIARELHDSLGQYLAGLAINVDLLGSENTNRAPLLSESRELLNRAISEVRTLSHLLHPPLLDEVGFASAARWYVEGFAKRSGIHVTLDLPELLSRLPENVELGLFRVLQEGLTNVHRHSGSNRAEVSLQLRAGQAWLRIRDYGRGIPEEVLRQWRTTGSSGVGLSGMRERVQELHGKVEISGLADGTLILVNVPLEQAQPAEPEPVAKAAAASA
jgi:signal transduction histidine kinase